MKNSRWFINKLKNENGFSLVELIVAFAMLAIVSGAIFQLFITGAKINKKGLDYDQANAYAKEISEIFKSNPKVFLNTYTMALNTSKLNYLDRDFASVGTVHTDGFNIEMMVTTEAAVTQPSIENDFAAEWTLNSGVQYNLVLDSTGVINIITPGNSTQSAIFDFSNSDEIPIIIDNVDQTQEKNITLTNNSTKTAILYIINDSITTPPRLQITPLNGKIIESRAVWEPNALNASKNILYKLEIKVIRNDDTQELLIYDVKEYAH